MKIAGLVLGFLFLISAAVRANMTDVSDINFDRGIDISQALEKISAQDVNNILPVMSEPENESVSDDSNKPDTIFKAVAMLESKLRALGIYDAKISVDESYTTPFIKVLIKTSSFENERFKKALKLFIFKDGSVFYLDYKVQLSITVTEPLN